MVVATKCDRVALKCGSMRRRAEALIIKYGWLYRSIITFWRHPKQRASKVWAERKTLHTALWAACLCPGGYLSIIAPAVRRGGHG